MPSGYTDEIGKKLQIYEGMPDIFNCTLLNQI